MTIVVVVVVVASRRYRFVCNGHVVAPKNSRKFFDGRCFYRNYKDERARFFVCPNAIIVAVIFSEEL